MADTSKTKTQIFNSKQVNTRLGAGDASSSSGIGHKPSPLMNAGKPKKKDYSKNQKDGLVSNANFGLTGLTGES